MGMDTTSQPAAAPNHQGTRFGPSIYMVAGGLVVHPLMVIGLLWGAFSLFPAFRHFLWRLSFAPWRRTLLSFWDLTVEHPYIWVVLIVVAVLHLVIRFSTARFSFTDDYVFLQIGLFSLHSPGGPFRVFNDPIAFSTITDANSQKGFLGLITGTGTLLIKSTDMPNKIIRLTWVPNVADAQRIITDRAGVRKARMLSSIRGN